MNNDQKNTKKTARPLAHDKENYDKENVDHHDSSWVRLHHWVP
jgi:hypothetical protein